MATLGTYQEVLDLYTCAKGEKKMTIGEDKCHLCGSESRGVSAHTFITKKNKTRVSKSITYRCGTYVYITYWYREDKGEQNRKQTVTLGKRCIAPYEAR